MLSFFKKVGADLAAQFKQYQGDTVFLAAAAAASANVTAADGKIDDAEVDAAISGMLSKDALKAAFTPAAIEGAVGEALNRAKTRSGRMENIRAIQAMAVRPAEQRQDVFLIAADVADQGGSIGPEEDQVLAAIAKELNLDKNKLLNG